MDHLLNVRQAARLLGLAPRTLRRRAARGEFPRIKLGRTLRFQAAALEEFVAAHSRPAKAASDGRAK